MAEPDIVVGVPGPWENADELIRALVQAQGNQPRFLFMGNRLFDLAASAGFEVEVYPPDPNLVDAFRHWGQGQIAEATLDALAAHRSTVYVLSEAGLEPAKRLLAAVATLLEAGGYAAKVESAGVAHEADKWRHLAELGTSLACYDALVTLVGGEEDCFSCGMRAFGLPDAAVSTAVPGDELAEWLTALNQRTLLTGPPTEGELFAIELGGRVLELVHQPYGYPEDSPLNNPHGKWLLRPTDRPLTLAPAFEPTGEPLFMALETGSPEVVEARHRAQATLPWFVAFLESPYGFGQPLFKVRIEDGDSTGNLWVAPVEVGEGTLTGRFFETPPGFPYAAGDAITVPFDEVVDWAVIRLGALIGGFSMRLSRAKVDPAQRRHYDLYTGVLCEEPLSELLGEAPDA